MWQKVGAVSACLPDFGLYSLDFKCIHVCTVFLHMFLSFFLFLNNSDHIIYTVQYLDFLYSIL